MDIYLLRNGQETGPFSLETTRALLQQREVAAADLAWRAGREDWTPLGELLASSSSEPREDEAKKSAAETSPAVEPATDKQKALLNYLGTPLAASLSKDQAALLLNDAMEDPHHSARLAHWNEDRLLLHPELFAAEIQGKKENRASHFFELCQTTGADYFDGITKAHCQVLVGFLDVKFPNWDAREAEAAEHYFYPAVAEKFPQLVQKQWRGRLHYADGLRVSPENIRKSPTSKLAKRSTSPASAILRGVFFGGLILAALYLAQRTWREQPNPTASAELAPLTAIAPAIQATAAAIPAPSAAPLPSPTANPQDPGPASSPSLAEAGPIPIPAAAPEAPSGPATVPPASGPAPDAAMTPTAASAPIATPPSDPAMTTSALATAPMAALPNAEPPVPLPPPPATLPTAAASPNPPDTAAIPAAPAIPDLVPATTRINLLLTKPVEIQLAYGKMQLPIGTPVKLVTRQGSQLKVSYQSSFLTIPAASTDLE